MRRWHVTLGLCGLAVLASFTAEALHAPAPAAGGTHLGGHHTLAPPEQEADVEATAAPPLFSFGGMPEAPRRPPHNIVCGAWPTPSGPLLTAIVTATHRGDCPQAVDTLLTAMKESTDHAVLAKRSWVCFSQFHSSHLEAVRAKDWEEFSPHLQHFDGTPEQREAQLRDRPDLQAVPDWYRPPAGGLEYRMMRFSEDELFENMVVYPDGPEKIADHLFADLWFEAVAAQGLASEYARRFAEGPHGNLALEQAWARRVYALAHALQSKPGRYVDDHRRADVPLLRAMLDAATPPDAPPEVLRARRVAEGLEEPPGPAGG